jgi:uracil-DNA glycosylase
MWNEYWDDRGNPWDYDPGPPRNRSWPRIFAETPDYRAIGKHVTGREAFRWHFGPMFYRGRLRDGRVRVLVIGQEGAQDESLSHRSFTGGTGARMQYFLKHIGITRSYLFLNTFVYPIFGQYNDSLRPIAQDLRSPIVEHRHDILDYVVARNDLRLVIAVGRAAKETVATWIKANGGTAQAAQLHRADTGSLSPDLKVVGVRHPGGASKGGSVSAIIADFKSAIRRIERWAAADANWLPVDTDGHRLPAADYRYRSAPIPFRDLPFGTAWRLGRGGTSSNRGRDQRSIQIFSASGKYNGRGHQLSYRSSANGSPDGYDAPAGDLPYEPPKDRYRDFDTGPGRSFARLLQGGVPGLAWPEFPHMGLRCHPSFGYGPIYRGRLYRPSLLLLADQQSHDDQFMGRAMTGDAGQHLQAFLTAAGVDRSYAILRVLPVDTLEEDAADVRAAVDHPGTIALYQETVRRSRPQVVVAVGPHSRRLLGKLDLGSTPSVAMKSQEQSRSAADWRSALSELRTLRYGKDLTRPSFSYGGERQQIPRYDLPFGTLRWQATSGDRALQARRSGRPSPDYYKLVMPRWAFELDPEPLGARLRRRLEPFGR